MHFEAAQKLLEIAILPSSSISLDQRFGYLSKAKIHAETSVGSEDFTTSSELLSGLRWDFFFFLFVICSHWFFSSFRDRVRVANVQQAIHRALELKKEVQKGKEKNSREMEKEGLSC